MAVSDLEDYDVYSHLSDEELLQIAVERSLADIHRPPGSDQITSSSSSASAPAAPAVLATPTQTNPNPRQRHDPPRNLYYVPHLQPPPSDPPEVPNCANPPTALSQFLYKGFKREVSPLQALIMNGDAEALMDLVRCRSSSLTDPDDEGWMALHEAAFYGQIQCVRILVRAHPDSVNKCNLKNQTALPLAAERGNVSCVDFLLKHGADPNIANKDQETPLFTGADINGQAGDGASPLYEACKNGHVSAVEALLSLRADTNRSTKSGLLPLHVAVQNNHIRIVSLLIPVTSSVRVRRSGISPLHIAAERDRDDIMELLIKSGFNVNAKLSEERSMMYKDRRSTPLYFSIYNGNLEAAEMLLEAGADPNLDIFNPLLIAVRLGRMDMTMLLLKYGADVNAQISTQPSSFPSALLLNMECLPMLKLLLDHGCDARPCFDCPYGHKPHPSEDMQVNRHEPARRQIQFCEAVSSTSFYRVTGPIISMLLDYVSHVRLCSRLLEVLDSHSGWAPIKLKALPPHPLMQLCRLKIRRLVGVRRLKLLHTLPLPARLIRFLHYDIQYSLT
ncbi:ankyrin repeat and SOCS box protein 2-like isoform X3 [Seriola lalandi dorsalis]|uniref:ankyrin repeat and SOCS box protein 2-like isoform X3 n=1 Tax=Seriola lalandi dorsalis TaxID=1841481 RepID=UPI000C6F6C4D|nr:ankyrin repeat and SOCS box protein 2-like isoform X3 [Seriola lalandi dorsalis]